MLITPDGPDATLVLNGRQTRVLNVGLDPYIPTLPQQGFNALVGHIIDTYQEQNPEVLLNVVMSPVLNTHSFAALPRLLWEKGFDVLELDALYLGFLVSQNLINRAAIAGDQPLPVAREAATYEGELWGIPSWLSTDFVYGSTPPLRKVRTLGDLRRYLRSLPADRPALVSNFNGSRRLPAMYINAYVQTYGYKIESAMRMPPDPKVIANLVQLTDSCAFGSINNCTNGWYQNSGNSAAERAYANTLAWTDISSSEQSFFINLYGADRPLYAIPAPWGSAPQPLLFADIFVSNRSTCPPASPCASDATAFTTLMTGAAMKTYIVTSQDLPTGAPWRTLLAATQPFYQQTIIEKSFLYEQLTKIFSSARPFPNSFTQDQQAAMESQICTALKAQRPNYACNTTPPVASSPKGRLDSAIR